MSLTLISWAYRGLRVQPPKLRRSCYKSLKMCLKIRQKSIETTTTEIFSAYISSLAAIKGSLQMRYDANCSSAEVAHDNKLIITTTAGNFFLTDCLARLWILTCVRYTKVGLYIALSDMTSRFQVNWCRAYVDSRRLLRVLEVVDRLCWFRLSAPLVGFAQVSNDDLTRPMVERRNCSRFQMSWQRTEIVGLAWRSLVSLTANFRSLCLSFKNLH